MKTVVVIFAVISSLALGFAAGAFWAQCPTAKITHLEKEDLGEATQVDLEAENLRRELESLKEKYRHLLAQAAIRPRAEDRPRGGRDLAQREDRPRPRERAVDHQEDPGDDEPTRDPRRYLRYMPLKKYRPYRRYRAYLRGEEDRFGSKKDCDEHPFDELCLGTEVSCERDPNSPTCFGTAVYCREFPLTDYCIGTESYCIKRPDDSVCMGTLAWCSRHRRHPACSGSMNFCKHVPKSRICLGTEAHCENIWNQYLCVPDPP